MLKKLTTAVGMMLLASSFALAGQTSTARTEQPRVTQGQRSQQNKTAKRAKRHGKRHKNRKNHKHHAQAGRR